jgi:hypothetical protein
MERNGSIFGFMVAGALLGILCSFRIFRFIIIGLVLWGVFLYAKDSWSETWIDGTDSSGYEFNITKIERTDYSSRPEFWVDVEVKNVSKDFMEVMEIDAILYECQDRIPVLERCQALSTTPIELRTKQFPGFLYRNHQLVSFNYQEMPESSNLLVQMNVRRVKYDADRSL